MGACVLILFRICYDVLSGFDELVKLFNREIGDVQ